MLSLQNLFTNIGMFTVICILIAILINAGKSLYNCIRHKDDIVEESPSLRKASHYKLSDFYYSLGKLVDYIGDKDFMLSSNSDVVRTRIPLRLYDLDNDMYEVSVDIVFKHKECINDSNEW